MLFLACRAASGCWLPGRSPCSAGWHGGLPRCCLLARLFFLALIFHLHLQTGLFMSISLKRQLAQGYPGHFTPAKAGVSGSSRSHLARGPSSSSLLGLSLGSGFGTLILLSLCLGQKGFLQISYYNSAAFEYPEPVPIPNLAAGQSYLQTYTYDLLVVVHLLIFIN